MQEKVKQELTLDNLHKIAEGLLLKDGGVDPVVLLCSDEGTVVVEMPTEFLENVDLQEYAIKELAQKLVENNVYKLFIVSECMLSDNEEGFQILEITHDTTQSITQAFTRNKDVATLSGKSTKTNELLVDLKPLQKALHPLG